MRVKPGLLPAQYRFALIAVSTVLSMIATAASTLPIHTPAESVAHAGVQLQPTASRLDLCCGQLIRSMAIADLNGDGYPDIITGDDNSILISVQLSDGAGGFAEAFHLPLGDPTLFGVRLATGDVTGDGHFDIVAGGHAEDEIVIFAGDGKGAFGPPTWLSIGTGRYANAVATADVNGDGHGDIVVTNGDQVTVLLADGVSGFEAPLHFPTGVHPYPGQIAIADLDGDGNLDIATVHAVSRDVSILWGDGQGAFSPPLSVPVGPYAEPGAIAIADVDNDGRPDIVVANTGLDDSPYPPNELAGSVSVLINAGQRGFAAAVQYAAGPGPGRAHDVVLGDITGDGQIDIAISRPLANSVDVLIGNGDGTFAAAAPVPTGDGPSPIAMADVTSDGNVDIVVANAVGSSISILPGDGDGGIGFDGNFEVGSFPHAVVAVDLNGDGHEDVITANMLDNDISVRLNDGNGGFLPQVRYPTGTVPAHLSVGDVNGDGYHDLVVANRFGATVSVFLGDGLGGFKDARNYPVGEADMQPYGLTLGDVNGDGHLDIATVNWHYPDTTVALLLGDGSGEFGSAVLVPVGDGDGTISPQDVMLTDVTGDGHVDIVVANLGIGDGGNLQLLVGDGSGGFAAAVPLATGDGPVGVEAADVNGDGHLDLISLNTTAQNVSVLLGDGAGGFTDSREYAISPIHEYYELNPWPWGFTLGDIDGDGHLDIITANTQTNTISVVRNDGAGAFNEFHIFETGQQPGAVTVSDVNGDGRMDVISANRGNNDFSVLFNRTANKDLIFANGFD